MIWGKSDNAGGVLVLNTAWISSCLYVHSDCAVTTVARFKILLEYFIYFSYILVIQLYFLCKANKYFVVKVVYLLQIEHHKQQMVKTLTPRQLALNSWGQINKSSSKGVITLRFSLLFTLAKWLLTTGSSRVRIEDVKNKYYYNSKFPLT